MGKATIISDVGEGRYTVSMVYAGRARVTAWVADLTAKIAALETAIAEMDDGMEKTIAELRVQSFVKKKQYYESKMPDDRTVTVWCVDKTESLTGSVGTIEVPGERHDGVNIQPGYEANAVYDAARDGQLLPAVATSAEAAYFNRAIMPGWQKDKPTYRYATIVADSIDFDADTCDVCLDPAYSSQQNLDINQNQGFSECESYPPSGFGQFCTDNPAHPTCTNTDAPGGLHISDAQYETIKNINAAVNAAHDYQTDKSGYGVGEHWEIMNPGDKGDCEDFALTKMQALIDAGFDVKNLQLGWGQTETGGNHAFLIIQTNNRGTLILDNRYPGLMQIGNVPYRFQGYQRAGQTWASYTTLLEAVAIEYMSCNAEAFADWDEVVVEFTGQDFATPKVIGFKSDPASCLKDMFYMGIDQGEGFCAAFVSTYSELTETWDLVGAVVDGGFGTASIACSDNIYLWGLSGYCFRTQLPPDTFLVDTNLRFLKIGGSWSSRAAVPFPNRSHSAGFLVNSKIYITGGYNYRSLGESPYSVYADVDEYDDALDSWAAKGNFSARWGHKDFVLGGYGYIFCGSAEDTGIPNPPIFLSSLYMYYHPGDSWQAKMSFPNALLAPASFELDKGYVFGGWQDSNGPNTIFGGQSVYISQKLHAYDADLNTWAEQTPLSGSLGNSFNKVGGSSLDYGYVISLLVGGGLIYRSWDPSAEAWVSIDSPEFNIGTAIGIES